MLRRLLVIAALLLSLLVAAPASAELSEGTLLMPGVTYDRQVEFTFHGPVVLHVLTAPRPDGRLYRLEPALSNGSVVATEPLTAIEQNLSGEGTAAGVNGDYFSPKPGDPKGILIQNGVMVTPPLPQRSSLGIAPDGSLQVDRVSFTGIWRGTGQRRPMTLNEPPSGGAVTLYTPAWGPTTPAEGGRVIEDVIESLPPTRPNSNLTGVVSQTVANGGVAIPAGGAVLVARRNQAPILARDAPVGTTLFLRLSLTPNWSGMVGAIGGGPVIVQDGHPVFRADESFGSSLLNVRSPRTAVGQLADGRIVLVTTDGGRSGYSVGMTNFELALAMLRLGAVRAMALGSGAETSMAFDGALVNRPDTPAEPQIADALLVVYGGVYIPAPAASVVSPNGDGVDDTLQLSYRLVRPSTVTATVAGPGVRQVLDSGQRQPGLYTFTFAGQTAEGVALPEGGYRFSVAATDDQGQSSSAERGFALNDTLGSLAVAPAAVRLSARNRKALAVTFALASAASVQVTIETRSGIVVRTLATGNLGAGQQRLVWDGRTAAGTLAFGGAYLVRVVAGNSVGRVQLSAPFTARRG